MKFQFSILFIFLFNILVAQNDTILNTYNKQELLEDYDLMISALKEAHAGLYWYNSRAQFDSIIATERMKIKDGMNSYEFYRIASKIMASTKEGHAGVRSSRDIHQYFMNKTLIFPVYVKMLDEKLYIINDIEKHRTKGKVLLAINETPIDQILETIYSHVPSSDGYNKTGKIRKTVDYSKLAYFYADFFENKPKYELQLLNPDDNKISKIKVKSLSANDFSDLEKTVNHLSFDDPIVLEIDKQNGSAILSIHTFHHRYYNEEGNEKIAFNIFSSKIDSVFTAIKKANIKDLVIDIRQNGGGTEGYEDYVFSYLTDTPYSKYKYVQANALTYSFLDKTQYKAPERRESIESAMKAEFKLENDGRYLRRKNFMKVEPPKEDSYKGNIYVLISGKTYSGGSEFAALLKGFSNAIFIGEETGGGYYGQTSGFGLTLNLPNTKIRVNIPLLKFVVNVESEDIPFGRGIIPDYKTQTTYDEFVNNVDNDMALARQLILDKK